MNRKAKAANLSLLPLPNSVQLGDGHLDPGRPRFEFVASPNQSSSGAATEPSSLLTEATARCAAALGQIWDLGADAPSLDIRLEYQSSNAAVPQLGDDEAYELHVRPQGSGVAAPIIIRATGDWGLLHGLTTLTQLAAGSAGIACCQIVDSPRFAWRGLMLDPARHFIPIPLLLETLDGMSQCKLNVLHLHLSDDQGFRFSSTAYPALASPDHYTLAELTQLVDYAALRGIRVVPELDVPGHSTSWLAAYPEWGSHQTQPSNRFGVHKACLDVTSPPVFQAVVTLFRELAEVFPDRHLHIGGDEVNPTWWNESAAVQDFMARHSLPDAQALQADFTNRLRTELQHMGRTLLAWDEVLHPSFTPSSPPTVVQSWRGATARDRVLAAGHHCVESSGFYLDLMYPADVHYAFDPGADEAALVALEDGLLQDARFQHIAEGMRWTHHWRTAEEVAEPAATPGQLLGAEACLWSELVCAENLTVRLWSRLPAVAERFWSRQMSTLVDLSARSAGFVKRQALLEHFDLVQVQQTGLVAAGCSSADIALTELLEPVKWYARLLGETALRARLSGSEMPQARPYQVDTPLNRVIDYLLPESPSAAGLLDWLRSTGRAERESRWGQWRSLGQSVHLLAELQPLADNLNALATILFDFESASLSAGATLDALQRLREPQGDYLLAVVEPLAQWLHEQT